MNKYEEYQQKDQELKELVKSNSTELVQGMYEAFFNKYPEVKFVSTVGYIPGFNDGDACEFTSHSEFGSDYLDNLSEESTEEMFEAFGLSLEDDAEDNLAKIHDLNPDWDWQKYEYVEGHIDVDLLGKVHGYDWIVVAYKGLDGKVVVVQEDYDCGY